MTTIGKQWLERQVAARVARIGDKAKLCNDQQATAAALTISQIPDLIAEARDDAESVRIYGWVRYDDVSGESENRVDELAARLKTEARCLRESDLAGTALIIFVYCALNDLECFLVPERIPMNDHEYFLHVRPKLG